MSSIFILCNILLYCCWTVWLYIVVFSPIRIAQPVIPLYVTASPTLTSSPTFSAQEGVVCLLFQERPDGRACTRVCWYYWVNQISEDFFTVITSAFMFSYKNMLRIIDNHLGLTVWLVQKVKKLNAASVDPLLLWDAERCYWSSSYIFCHLILNVKHCTINMIVWLLLYLNVDFVFCLKKKNN